jgi:hypothetical protein
MVEGPQADVTERYCRQIAAVAQEKLAGHTTNTTTTPQ